MTYHELTKQKGKITIFKHHSKGEDSNVEGEGQDLYQELQHIKKNVILKTHGIKQTFSLKR